MRIRIPAILAYTGAGVTLAIAGLVPFYLIGAFTSLVAGAGLHIDPSYSGGTMAGSFARHGYQVAVYQPVHPRALQRIEPFVQVVFRPADHLPAQVNEEVDLDGDGQPDVRVSFTLPADPGVRLHGEVVALNGKFQSLSNVNDGSFSRLLVRTGNEVILRIPLAKAPAAH
jgi:hypothetical protein